MNMALTILLWTVLILAALILALLFSHFQLYLFYQDGEMELKGRLWFIKVTLYPRKKKKLPKDKEKKEAMPKEKKGFELEFSTMRKMLGVLLEALSKVARAVSVRKLELYAKVATDDPAKTGVVYGSACTALGIVNAFLENNFTIEKKRIEIYADYKSDQYDLFLKSEVCISIRKLLAAVLTLKDLLPLYRKDKKKDKAVEKNEQSSHA